MPDDSDDSSVSMSDRTPNAAPIIEPLVIPLRRRHVPILTPTTSEEMLLSAILEVVQDLAEDLRRATADLMDEVAGLRTDLRVAQAAISPPPSEPAPNQAAPSTPPAPARASTRRRGAR